MENTIKDAEVKVVSIQNAVNTTLETVHQLMKELEEQVEEHLKSMDDHMTQAKTNFHETCQYYVTKIQAHCQQEEMELQLQQHLHDTLPEILTNITQKVINEAINPQLDQHLKLLNEKIQEAIVTIQHQQKPPTSILPRAMPLTR